MTEPTTIVRCIHQNYPIATLKEISDA
jgi:hypothetical protein